MLKKIFSLICMAALMLVLCGFCSAQELKITMLNVGQGDAVVIQTETENILVDTSDVDERAKLRTALYDANIFRIDKLILTHPHADHIGNAAWLMQTGIISVRSVYDNGIVSTSRYYKNYIAECAKRNVPHNTLGAGDKIELGDGAYIEVLYPTAEVVTYINKGHKSDPNNESIVFRLVYRDFAMMFTGDAEAIAENDILREGANLKSTVLKAGHHGSKTSSSADFLSAVKPEFVIISAGEPTDKRGGNTYGHPHLEAVERYVAAGVAEKNIFWTWINGNITVTTDGTAANVTAQKKGNWVPLYRVHPTGYVTTSTKL